MRTFIIFTVINIADLVLSINGLRNNFLEEGSVAIKYLQSLTGVSIYTSIIMAKIGSMALASWLIFGIPSHFKDEERAARIDLKFLSKKGMMDKIIIGIAIVHLAVGVAPAYFFSLHFSPVEALFNRIFLK